MRNRLTALAFALTAPLMAQNKPFSQPWSFTTTGSWQPKDSIIAGAEVAVLTNIYAYQSHKYKHPALVAVLLTMGLSLVYEVSRWAEGKQPLMQNVFYAGIGGAITSITIRYTWGSGSGKLSIGQR